MDSGRIPSRDSALETSHSPSLIDNHGRPINYLRLAITDRCNLRCRYCMPEEGVASIKHDQALSYEELERLVRLFQGLGITKVRITGGEPFVRRGCYEFMKTLKQRVGIEQLYLTTNGVETYRYIERLKEIELSGINLSLDTLDRARFKELTRRDHIDKVLLTLNRSLEAGIPVKINSVVMEDTSDEDIINLVGLVRDQAISLRFIEQMPFSGSSEVHDRSQKSLRERLVTIFPELQEYNRGIASTALEFSLPGHSGTVGIIEGRSRKFCATCNKVRITPEGMLKACLYDDGVLDLRELLRKGVKDRELADSIRVCLNHRYADGHETAADNGREGEPSMASIGG